MSSINSNSAKIFSADGLKAFAKDRYGSLSGLAREMGISPQHLHGYVTGQRTWGAAFIQRLAQVGFKAQADENEGSVVNKSSSPLYLDIAGATELTRSPAKRLSQLIQVAPGTLEAWERGDESPTMAQLGALFNQVVALGLARCAEHDRRPAMPEERRAAAG